MPQNQNQKTTVTETTAQVEYYENDDNTNENIAELPDQHPQLYKNLQFLLTTGINTFVVLYKNVFKELGGLDKAQYKSAFNVDQLPQADKNHKIHLPAQWTEFDLDQQYLTVLTHNIQTSVVSPDSHENITSKQNGVSQSKNVTPDMYEEALDKEFRTDGHQLYNKVHATMQYSWINITPTYKIYKYKNGQLVPDGQYSPWQTKGWVIRPAKSLNIDAVFKRFNIKLVESLETLENEHFTYFCIDDQRDYNLHTYSRNGFDLLVKHFDIPHFELSKKLMQNEYNSFKNHSLTLKELISRLPAPFNEQIVTRTVSLKNMATAQVELHQQYDPWATIDKWCNVRFSSMANRQAPNYELSQFFIDENTKAYKRMLTNKVIEKTDDIYKAFVKALLNIVMFALLYLDENGKELDLQALLQRI